jgi:hypothetical protein
MYIKIAYCDIKIISKKQTKYLAFEKYGMSIQSKYTAISDDVVDIRLLECRQSRGMVFEINKIVL